MIRVFAPFTRTLTTRTFTSSQSWVAPPAITNLVSVSGKGEDGTSGGIDSVTENTVVVIQQSSGSSGAGNWTWSNTSLQNYASNIAADINADGNAAWTIYYIYVYPDGTNSYGPQPSALASGAVPGSAFVSNTSEWHTSGTAVTGDAYSRVIWQVNTPGSAGANTTGFGKTFPGGSAGSAATPATYTNVAVSPGTSYPIVVAPGGYVTITYYT